MTNGSAPPRWSLQDLLAAPEGRPLEDALAELDGALERLEAGRPRLTNDIAPDELLALLREYEQAVAVSHRLGAYAALWFAEDTQDQAALNLQTRLEQILAAGRNRRLFFELWVKGLPDDVAARLFPAAGGLRYFLESLRRLRPHTLSEPEERVINLKDVNGIDALVNVYEMITNRLTFTLDVGGERQTLTRDALSAFFRHPDPAMRQAAYQELYRVFAGERTLLAQIYNHRVQDWRAEALQLRHYREPISVRNLANDLPDAVTEALLTVCRENAAVFQRYFRLKARWLALDKLRRWDIYAPLAQSERQYPFAEAVELVMGSFGDFSPSLARLARRVLEHNHLDAEVRPRKRGGAFCYSALPGMTPWVLSNYNGRVNDVSTLAHELGHAVHSMMAAEHSVLTFHAALPLAETASVFGEMLLTERLMAQENDPAVRRDILARTIDDTYATVLRQSFFTLFERDAHRLLAEGHTIDELAAHYLDNLAAQFGDAVEVPDEFRWEWVAIPHFFFAPFYTYAYSFGQLLVLALYRQYQQDKDAFAPRYLRILACGGSAPPAQILSEAGLDIAAPAFWQGGFDVIRGLVDSLEQT